MCSNRNDGNNRDPAKEAELRRAARRERAYERLGARNPICPRCGETDPLVLEKHHLAGQAYSNDTVIVCRNCHRKLSDLQKDHPEKIADPADELETIAHSLLGVADLSEFLIDKFRDFAQQLLKRADPNRDNLEPGQ
jgi:hypothetical protein